MAKTFNSVAELEAYVIKKMQPAVKEVQEKVERIAFNMLQTFYGEYEPVVAIRTYQVLNSLVKTNVIRTGNGWECEVYFDLGALNHPKSYIGKNGKVVTSDWSEEEILSSVMTSGTHGGAIGGIAVWNELMDIIDPSCIQWLKQELISAGIPIQ